MSYSREKNALARREESDKLREKIAKTDFVILLDERGMEFSSPEFSRKIVWAQEQNLNLIFVLGGAYGVDENFRARADLALSFGKMVFPHQIARLVLVEQIYRAFAISRNLPYHHV